MQTDRIAFWGGSGSGKSFAAKQLQARFSRAITFDVQGEYHEEGYTPTRSLGEAYKMATAGYGKGFKIAYLPPAGNFAEALSDLSRIVCEIQDQANRQGGAAPLLLNVEEANTAFPPTAMKRGQAYFQELCFRGRLRNVSLFAISQRPNNVHPDFKGNVTKAFVFRLTDRNDINSVSDWIDGDPRVLRSLKTGECFYIDTTRDTFARRQKIKKRQF